MSESRRRSSRRPLASIPAGRDESQSLVIPHREGAQRGGEGANGAGVASLAKAAPIAGEKGGRRRQVYDLKGREEKWGERG